MNLIDALLGEHAVVYAILDHLDEVRASANSVDELKSALTTTSVVLRSHAKLEDELLFPALAQQGRAGPLAVMQAEHLELDAQLADLPNITELAELETAAVALVALARQHFIKEEAVLFRLGRQIVDDAVLSRLGDQWAKMRHVEVA